MIRAKTDRPEIFDFTHIINLWNESKESLINLPHPTQIAKNITHQLAKRRPYNFPWALEEHCLQIIRAPGFERSHMTDHIVNVPSSSFHINSSQLLIAKLRKSTCNTRRLSHTTVSEEVFVVISDNILNPSRISHLITVLILENIIGVLLPPNSRHSMKESSISVSRMQPIGSRFLVP